MAIQRAAEDNWTKEMAKFEQRPVMVLGTYIEPIPFADGGRGGAPFAEYPKMLYSADSFDGGPRINGYKIVKSEGEEALVKGQGYFNSQEDALADVPRRQLELAKLAANRAHNDQWMSDKAKAEAAAKDEQTMAHLPSIPETPILRRKAVEPK